MKFLVGTDNADWSCGRASAEQGFSLFLMITDWSTAPLSADFILFRQPSLADSCCWLEDSGLQTGSFAGLRESSSLLGTPSANSSCGRASAVLGFSLIMLLTDWITASLPADIWEVGIDIGMKYKTG